MPEGRVHHIAMEVYEILPPSARTISLPVRRPCLEPHQCGARQFPLFVEQIDNPEFGGSEMSPARQLITWAAVADGGKALVLVNDGTDAKPSMSVLSKSGLDNPPTREHGTDKPSRRSGTGPDQRSAMEATDWHEFEEARFVEEFAGRLNRAAERGLFNRLIIVAPPKVLGQLRPALSAQAAACVVAEIGSDLTGHPVGEIGKHIARALAR
jgi:protein required for attachment to host cells